MKTKYPSMFGVLAALLLVASFIIPTNLVSPSPVEAGVCKWDQVEMPGSVQARFDVDWITMFGQGVEVQKIAVGSDGATVLAAVKGLIMLPVSQPMLMVSPLMGIIWNHTPGVNLYAQVVTDYGNPTGGQVFDVAIAPDNPSFWAVVVSTDNTTGPREVYITENGGGKWTRTNLPAVTAARAPNRSVSAIDISVDYGGKRDIIVGMREGSGGFPLDFYVLQTAGFSSWFLQTVRPPSMTPNGNGDVFAVKFSPSYPADGAFAAVFTSTVAGLPGTYYNIALRDIDLNNILSWALAANVEVRVPPPGAASPTAIQLITADLELPSDFNGAATSLSRAYVSTDSGAAVASDGIFRMDNTTVYTLMDTTNDAFKRIASIAYYGTYASGKLLAGSVLGYACQASVPTWFTDSPTTCPVPCWYDCLKCPTGAAGPLNCTLNGTNPGNAQVIWFQNGTLAFAATGTYTLTSGNATAWWAPFVGAPVYLDETALSISRNNGETWNQLAFIDTAISAFNDFAISADCNTLYLASINPNDTGTTKCLGFDSVWRASLNPAVVAPLPPLPPLGFWYERVYTRPTALSCNVTQSNLPLLRLAGGCEEPTGQIIGWAAQNTKAEAWSPDYGDYWANITARDTIADFVFESPTVMYNLYNAGTVQKLPYTGTSWSTTLPTVNTGAGPGHMIAAMPEGQVLVGYLTGAGAPFPACISKDGAATFSPLMQPFVGGVDIHVAFDPDYANNSMIYIGDDADDTGHVYRANVAGAPFVERWQDTDMMEATNNNVGCPMPDVTDGIYGIAVAHTGGALYAANGCADNVSGVWRTLEPLAGIPKPGIYWDLLDVFTPQILPSTCFTLEPYSLKLCGCCTLDTDTTLYAIDNAAYSGLAHTTGFLWAFTDCMAKKGPALITEDKALIGCDPVSGRNQEINLCWEQLCVAQGYDIEIAKNDTFSIKVVDWVLRPACANFLEPEVLTEPCVYFPAGANAQWFAAFFPAAPEGSAIGSFGNLECGHTYYWRVQVRECVTGQIIMSPWSEVRSFTIKAGLPVSTPYYGPQLLAPNNGCLGCPVSPASFSWSPFKETTKYKFVLASDAAMTQVIQEAEVATTAFEYAGKLDYSTNYFWRVMSLEPAPSDWSATFSFQTEAAPAPVTPEKPAATPVWVWVVIAIGAILVIVTLVLIFKTRRV